MRRWYPHGRPLHRRTGRDPPHPARTAPQTVRPSGAAGRRRHPGRARRGPVDRPRRTARPARTGPPGGLRRCRLLGHRACPGLRGDGPGARPLALARHGGAHGTPAARPRHRHPAVRPPPAHRLRRAHRRPRRTGPSPHHRPRAHRPRPERGVGGRRAGGRCAGPAGGRGLAAVRAGRAGPRRAQRGSAAGRRARRGVHPLPRPALPRTRRRDRPHPRTADHAGRDPSTGSGPTALRGSRVAR